MMPNEITNLEKIQIARQHANDLRKEKKYEEALAAFEKLQQHYPDQVDKWDLWGKAFCLKHQKKYKEALDICRNVWEKDHAFVQNNSLYAWCIYFTEIALPQVRDEIKYLHAGEGILRLSAQEDKYSPYTITVLKILDYLNNKNLYPTDKILEWTTKLHPDQLETEAFVIRSNDGKERELASQKEKYYMWRTKALLEKEMYEECIQLCKDGLEKLDKFHYSNDVWFARRISLSHKAMGQTQVALNELHEILKKKKEWFIQMEIAQIYHELARPQDALMYAVEACLSFGDMEYKMNLFLLMAVLLSEKQMMNEAKKHLELIYQIKREKNWRINQEFQQWIDRYQIDVNIVTPPKQIFNELKQLWNKLKFGDQPLLKGHIKAMNPNGKTGFVELPDKKSYFFRVKSFRGKVGLLKIGFKVTFYLEDGIDPKKGTPVKNAINIKPDPK